MEQFKASNFKTRDEALRIVPGPRLSAPAIGRLGRRGAAARLGTTAVSPEGWYGIREIYIAAKGDRRNVTLADGSRLELNTDSQATVHINRWRRTVELARGEAFFTVFHDPDRPFEVRAENGVIRDIGTEFEVYIQPERVLVAVQEGSVRVEAKSRRDPVADQQIAYTRSGNFEPVAGRDIAGVTAWRRGQLAFRARPLGEVLAEAGRYHDTKIRLTDETLRDLPVSGIFRTANLDAILNTITMTLPVKSVRIGEREILLQAVAKRC
jgi:transmembrane sensor